MQSWARSLRKPRVILGFDANETFTDPDGEGWRAHTGRGEMILLVLAQFALEGPPQELHVPTYHPYNTTQRQRRLDYMLCKGVPTEPGRVADGSRHMARSDHDLVWLDFVRTSKLTTRLKPTWGARRFAKGVDVHQEISMPPTQMDTHAAIHELALPDHRARQNQRQVPGERGPQTSQAGSPPGTGPGSQGTLEASLQAPEARVPGMAWGARQSSQPSPLGPGAYRTLNQYHARVGWQHGLTDDPQWQSKLRGHFRSIFAKAPAARTQRRLGDTRLALTRLCKHQAWQPFTADELHLTTRTVEEWEGGRS